MKKIILLLGLLVLANNAAFADCDYQCVAPYDLNNKFRTVMSAVTGANSIIENKLETIIKKEVLKIASADNLKIKLDSYSPRDLKNGIFKSMAVSGNNVVLNNIYFTSLDLKTLCDFNYIKKSGDEIVFVEEMPLAFNVKISEKDINKTIENAKYQKIVKDLNKLGNSYGIGLQISSTKVSIRNNKLYYVIGFDVPFITKEPKLVIQTDLTVKDGKFDFTNSKLLSGNMQFDLKKLDFILDYLNPFDFSVNIFDNKDAKVLVKNVAIKEDHVVADGIIIVPKD